MKHLYRGIITVMAAILVATVFGAHTPKTHASSRDEAAIDSVSAKVDALWSYVEASIDLPDDEFYPEFAKRAKQTNDELGKAYDTLGKSNEKGRTKESIGNIRNDLLVMRSILSEWREAALAKDATGFEAASYSLSEAIDILNEDIDEFNSAAYGTEALMQVLAYAGVLAVSLFVSAMLFAWAVLKNNKQETDAAQEALRKLRWQAAFISLLLPFGSLPPSLLYFFGDSSLPIWVWSVVIVGTAALIYPFVRYVQVIKLAKKG